MCPSILHTNSYNFFNRDFSKPSRVDFSNCQLRLESCNKEKNMKKEKYEKRKKLHKKALGELSLEKCILLH